MIKKSRITGGNRSQYVNKTARNEINMHTRHLSRMKIDENKNKPCYKLKK